MNIFICECLEEEYPDISLYHSVGRCVSRNFEQEYLKIFYEGDLYIFCVQSVTLCHQVNRWYFFGKTCVAVSSDLFSCYVSLKFGVKSLCPVCIRPLVKKLFPYLRQI